jgi:DNA helicase II / ATP-dependent DNA helicase PcrA
LEQICTRELHSKLNHYQHEVVHLKEGQYLVSACAGSGKSTVIVARTEQLIKDGVNPNKIGAFTFAKFAAGELQKKLKALEISTVTVSTLHALCYNILREDGPHIGGNFAVDDKNLIFYQTKDFIQRTYKGSGLDPKVADSLFGLAKANCLSAHPINEGQDKLAIIELFKKLGDKPWLSDAYYNLFSDVEAWKVSKQLLNYDDMLYLSWLLLVDHEDIQAKWADKFEYFMIDEAQDSSTVQNAIARMLSKKSNSIMVVGDSLQSLYKWRGANPEEFVAFAKQYKVYKLPVNYRSTTDICAAATKLTDNLPWNITGTTIPHEKAITDPTSIIAKEYENPNDEAVGIVEQILDLHKNGHKFKDTAILYRISALLQPIEDALVTRKIPYVVWSGYTFYDRKEIKDVLSYLYVISLRDNTEQHVKRAINVPFRYVSKQYIECVEDVAKSNSYSFIDAMKAYKGPRENVNTTVRKFGDLLDHLHGMYSRKEKPRTILEAMLSETRYIRSVSQEEGEEGPDPDSGAKLTHIHQLLKIAEGFTTVDTFLEYVAKSQQLLTESRKRKGSDAVVLSTIHSVKGMEFDVVFAPGWNEGIIPHLKNPSQDEELRIAYVCLTRAAKQFRCSWNRTQITQGGLKQLPMSKFITMAGLPMVKLPVKKKVEINVMQWMKDHPEFIEKE